MIPLTHISGVPDKNKVLPGMAFFPDTGPFGKTCGDCKFRGYWRQSAKEIVDPRTGEVITRTYRSYGCEMFKKLSGNHGPVVQPEWPSCKYFEKKDKAP